MDALTIGQVAEQAGVGVETIRFYERKGLVPEPPRTEAGYRQFHPEIVGRIRFIRRAQEVGFSLREAGELLSLQVNSSSECGDVRVRAQAKLDEVESKIRDLERVRDELLALVQACPGHGPIGDCAILETLGPGDPEGDGSCGTR